LRLVLTIAAIVLIAGFAQASTLTVCPSRCGYASIQAAVYAAHPNDTIEVHSGIYNESVILTKDITFNGIDTGSGEPIVNGDLYQNGFTSDLRGFSFQSVDSGFMASQNMDYSKHNNLLDKKSI
jgi:pectin methylesterase-like acyl-CoA thioesterase